MIDLGYTPVCDICHSQNAVADGKTKYGPWAYMCNDCLAKHGFKDSKEFTKYLKFPSGISLKEGNQHE